MGEGGVARRRRGGDEEHVARDSRCRRAGRPRAARRPRPAPRRCRRRPRGPPTVRVGAGRDARRARRSQPAGRSARLATSHPWQNGQWITDVPHSSAMPGTSGNLVVHPGREHHGAGRPASVPSPRVTVRSGLDARRLSRRSGVPMAARRAAHGPSPANRAAPRRGRPAGRRLRAPARCSARPASTTTTSNRMLPEGQRRLPSGMRGREAATAGTTHSSPAIRCQSASGSGA